MPEEIHQRRDTHGPYQDQFECSQRLKAVLRDEAMGGLDFVYIEALEMIMLKISRILTGDPTFEDHWEDIAGYAMRVVGK